MLSVSFNCAQRPQIKYCDHHIAGYWHLSCHKSLSDARLIDSDGLTALARQDEFQKFLRQVFGRLKGVPAIGRKPVKGSL